MISSDNEERNLYQNLLDIEGTISYAELEETITAPMFTYAVKDIVNSTPEYSGKLLPNYGLLGFHVGEHPQVDSREPILMNVNTPSSTFICGSQGSGKSYTLSCMLENCLLSDSRIGKVDSPIAGVAFHYDRDSSGSVAEAAYLCSRGIKVKVLVSESNQHKLRAAYENLENARDHLTVEPLLLPPSDLSTERMLKLMAVAEKENHVPLYMEVIRRILRHLAIKSEGRGFDYFEFKRLIEAENLTKDQIGPLNLRLELLESFLDLKDKKGKKGKQTAAKDLFNLSSGSLTIVDLSDPFLDPTAACSLFDICLSLVKERRPACGMVVALDEAHKYINKSAAASNLMERLVGTIREQRHNATRIIIATQEPTISEKLLDLCSTSIVHRFTSPAWFSSIKEHLGGASGLVLSTDERETIFDRIVNLHVGESLVFSPTSFFGVDKEAREIKKLGPTSVKMKTRQRLGVDGGASVLITRASASTKEKPLVVRSEDQNLKNNCVSETQKVPVSQKGSQEASGKRENGDEVAVHKQNLANGFSTLNREKSHLILICCVCEEATVIEYDNKILPKYSNSLLEACKDGIAYLSCSHCRTTAGATASKGQLKAFELKKSTSIQTGSLKMKKSTRDQLTEGLKPHLGGSVQTLNEPDGLAYLRAAVITSTLGSSSKLWSARLLVSKEGDIDIELISRSMSNLTL